MAATACLFNLSKAELSQQLHPSILRQIVEVYLYSISINSQIIFTVKQNCVYGQAVKVKVMMKYPQLKDFLDRPLGSGASMFLCIGKKISFIFTCTVQRPPGGLFKKS